MTAFLTEIQAIVPSQHVLPFHVNAIALDEWAFAEYCGMHQVFTDMTQQVGDYFVQNALLRKFTQYAEMVLGSLLSHLRPIVEQLRSEGTVVLSLMGNPASLLRTPEAQQAHDDAVQCYHTIVRLRLQSVSKAFETCLASTISLELERALQSESHQYYHQLYSVIVQMLMLPRLIGIPRHAIARVLNAAIAQPDSVGFMCTKRATKVSANAELYSC